MSICNCDDEEIVTKYRFTGDLLSTEILKRYIGMNYHKRINIGHNWFNHRQCPKSLVEKTCHHCSLFRVSFSVLNATFLMQHSMSIGVLQCNSHFCVKNTWNIKNSLTNTNLLYLKIYKWHNLHLQSEKIHIYIFLNIFIFHFESKGYVIYIF